MFCVAAIQKFKGGVTRLSSEPGATPTLLATYDLGDVANIADFSRASAAGYTGSGETTFQREAAVDEIRDDHYRSGVRGTLLEDSPTACVLTAPTNIFVNAIAPETINVSYDDAPVTVSRLRSEYRFNGTGSWTSNGTNTTLNSIHAPPGTDVVLNLRFVSTSGVAGTTANYGPFSVTAGPPTDYDLNWRFNGDLLDSSANAFHGTVVAGAAAYVSNAIDLNGATRIANASFVSYTTSDFSVSLWCNLDSLAADSVLVTAGQFQVGGFYIVVDSAGTLVIVTNQTGAYQVTASAPGAFSTGVLTHLAFVRDGASILIYRDGVDVTATAGTHINPTSYGGFGIGAYDASGVYSAFVDGRMDDVRVFGRALTGPEVTALYGGGAL